MMRSRILAKPGPLLSHPRMLSIFHTEIQEFLRFRPGLQTRTSAPIASKKTETFDGQRATGNPALRRVGSEV